jgi:nucleotidyltransferase/DNA polymerase involved in DNA repair
MKKSSGLQIIPGIGKSMEQDLNKLGITAVEDLKGKNPQTMYERLCALCGQHVDRCVLYVFRCAVYFAEHETRDPEKLKWWNWKD